MRNINEIIVSLFSNVMETKLPEQSYLVDVLDSIRQSRFLKSCIEQVRKETDHDKRNELKVKLLPVVCFSGTFSERSDDNLIDINPIICLDLDSVNDTTAERNRLKSFPYVFAIFTSPTGTGLKVLVYHDLVDPSYHKDLYADLGTTMGLTGRSDLKFDMSCSNVSRACFMSVDSGMYLNTNPQPYQFHLTTTPSTFIHSIPLTPSKEIVFPTVSLTDYNKIREKIKDSHTLFESRYSMYPGVRNKNLFILASFFRYDGIPEDIAADYLIAYYQDSLNRFPATEIRKTVESAYK